MQLLLSPTPHSRLNSSQVPKKFVYIAKEKVQLLNDIIVSLFICLILYLPS